MSDTKKRLQDAMARSAESYEDREAREAQERDEAVAYFEQAIVPGFEAAAAAINEQAAANDRRHEPPAYAETDRGSWSEDGMYAELIVRRGMEVEFWFRGMARMRTMPVEWKYRRRPRITQDGRATSMGTDKELKWPVSLTEWTSEQVAEDLLTRYVEILEVLNRQRW